MDKLPPQVMGPWKMDVEAARHTLEYVYGKLHHACYMLCVTAGKPVLYKLEERTTAPGFEDALFNKKLKKTMRARPTREKQWRVIQCLVKPYSEESTFTEAYVTFLDKLSVRLPDGVFLMNLTDAVLLKKDGNEPWPMVNGPGSIGKYNFSTHIPILGGSSQVGYWDVPIPNYDDVQLILGMDKNLPNPDLTNWEKKSERAVFRGAPTGCGYTLETNMRLKLATMKSDDLDVGVITVKSNSIKFDPKEGMGQLDMTGKIKAVNRLSLDEQAGFKYIIHIDGNVAAYRLLKMMTTGSLILKVKGPYILWVDHLLKNKEHYVEVKEDLSDLKEVIDWCRSHDAECKKIAKQGMDFAKKALTKEFVDGSFSKILWSMSGEPSTPEFSPNPTEPEVPPMSLDEPAPVKSEGMYVPLDAGKAAKLPQGTPTILVPFREQKEQKRGKQLTKFVEFIKKKHPDWNLIVVEQSDDGKKFNRGALLNAGAKMAEEAGATYVVFHDVDLRPKSVLVPYYTAIPEKPIHIAKAWTTKYDSPTFLGGVLSMKIEDVKKVNGFPNNFWGWGGEDDALRNRIETKKLQVWQPTIRGEGFNESEHVDTRTNPEWKNMEKWENMKAEKVNSGTNGLNNLDYSVKSEENYTDRMKKVTVELK
jgi:hypothetical protein